MEQPTRRDFMIVSGGAIAALTAARAQLGGASGPWYRRALRWGQTNLNELDPKRYDADFWRQHWKRTRVQGIIVNAGGIVAYYPSKFLLHYRARYLGERDLYGEITRAAHSDGIFVLARMDSNRATEEFYRTHPDWFARNAEGRPYRAGDRYLSCIDGPYYEEYLPAILREIIEWEKPEGFTDNSWSGLDRNQICYCEHSRRRFRATTGMDLPRKKDWNDPAYRQWIKWSYQRRVEVWDLNNRTTKTAGGPDCLWVGMLGGDIVSSGQRFRDVKTIAERSEAIMLDDQGRSMSIGFQENAEIGKRLHGLLGWDKIIPESMATYQRAPTFRKAAASHHESRMWMYSGFAGGIQPWWHHVGAYQWDRRQFRTEIPVCEWHAANEQYLVNRRPVATVGVVYSQTNADFYGRDAARERVEQPYYGIIQALVRARIPYLPVHADHIERDGGSLSLLILPNLAAWTDAQLAAVRRYAERGAVLATGETSLYDEWGDARKDIALGDLLGVKFTGRRQGATGEAQSWEGTGHSYLRLDPPVGRNVYGARSGEEPAASQLRHPILRGFDETDVVAFGGLLLEVERAAHTEAPLTFVPSFPAYPPEMSWERVPRTKIPAVVLNERVLRDASFTGLRRQPPLRCAYLAADLDRRFAHDNLPDHGDLLANLIRWTANEDIPLQVEGAGLVDCHLYSWQNGLILHVVNVTSAGTWRSPVHELIPLGPLEVRVRLRSGAQPRAVRLLKAGGTRPHAVKDGWAVFELKSVADHELVVIE